MVARAISRVPVPVISAIGHETDVTIADFVADVRAPTPSAAAELVVSRKDEFCSRIDRLRDRLRSAARGRVQALSRRIHIAGSRPAFAAYPARLAMRGRHVGDLTHAVARVLRASIAVRARRLQLLDRQLAGFDAGRRLAALRTRLVAAEGRISGGIARRQDRARGRLRTAIGRLESLSPLAVPGTRLCGRVERRQNTHTARSVQRCRRRKGQRHVGTRRTALRSSGCHRSISATDTKLVFSELIHG